MGDNISVSSHLFKRSKESTPRIRDLAVDPVGENAQSHLGLGRVVIVMNVCLN